MSICIVDERRCKGDGICVAACPVGILIMDKTRHVPVPVAGGEEFCIKCGHCVASCPTGAMSIEEMLSDECEPLKPEWRISPDKLVHFMRGRRSVRVFKEEPVDRKVLEKVIDAARYAPSGVNRQPVYWAVVLDRAKVRELAGRVVDWMRALIEARSPMASSFRMERIVKAWGEGKDYICRNAPHLIIAYSLKDDMTAPQSCTIALTYLELAAASFGLGACWAGYMAMAINTVPEIQKISGISQRAACYGALLVGTPMYEYRRIPLRNSPRIAWR